jgi:molybdate transport system regulatory protein
MSKKKTASKGTHLGFKGLVWISRGDSTFLGQGRVALLEKIREYGSISEAARSMDMSYKHAWDLIDSINRQAGSPLVVKTTGGRGGGGARLTEDGERAVKVFWEFHDDFVRFLRDEEQKLRLWAPA